MAVELKGVASAGLTGSSTDLSDDNLYLAGGFSSRPYGVTVEGTFQLGDPSKGLSGKLDALVGTNAQQTLPVPAKLQAPATYKLGGKSQPVDLVQLFGQYCFDLSVALCMSAGRVASSYATDYISENLNNFIFHSLLTPWVPYTQTGFQLSLGRENVQWTAMLGPEPDGLDLDNLAHIITSLKGGYPTIKSPVVYATLNALYGSDPAKDSDPAKTHYNVDALLGIAGTWLGVELYLLRGAQAPAEGASQSWNGWSASLRVGKSDGLFRGYFRIGMGNDEGPKTAIYNFKATQATLGLTVQPLPWFLVRANAERISCGRDCTPFEGQSDLTRAGIQAVFFTPDP